MIKLSELKRKDFKPEDFFKSITAEKNNIDNTPKGYSVRQCLLNTADKCQEIQNKIRLVDPELIFAISSCYRTLELNKIVNGSPTSKHMQGLAVDFLFAKKKNKKLEYYNSKESLELLFRIKDGIKFDKILIENRCVHIQFCLREQANRMLVGTAELINGNWVVKYM
jgi:hypothetical protein